MCFPARSLRASKKSRIGGVRYVNHKVPEPNLESQLRLSSLVKCVVKLNSAGSEVDGLNESLRAKTQRLLSSILNIFKLGVEVDRVNDNEKLSIVEQGIA